jgi:hypothetical protein
MNFAKYILRLLSMGVKKKLGIKLVVNGDIRRKFVTQCNVCAARLAQIWPIGRNTNYRTKIHVTFAGKFIYLVLFLLIL